MKRLNFKTKTTTIALLAGMVAAGSVLAKSDGGDGYEYWAADQSNSVPGVASRGVSGSFMWIWDSKDVDKQL